MDLNIALSKIKASLTKNTIMARSILVIIPSIMREDKIKTEITSRLTIIIRIFLHFHIKAIEIGKYIASNKFSCRLIFYTPYIFNNLGCCHHRGF